MTATNLRGTGEVSSPVRLLAVNEHTNRGLAAAPNSRAAVRRHGVVEDGMVGKWSEISRESPAGAEPVFMIESDPKSRRRRAVRASVVALKRSNARGAKGRRKMEAR